MDVLELIGTPEIDEATRFRPGYFGKLPQRSDFIHTGLNREFVDAWDTWLSEGVNFSRQSLEDTWLEHYLHAPVWRFYLAKGIIGNTAQIGIWFPSMDKVGRYFPMTFCCAIEEAPSGWLDKPKVNEFLDNLERIGMVALDEACGMEDVDEALHDLAWPLQSQQKFDAQNIAFGGYAGNKDVGLLNHLFDIVRKDHPKISLWWTHLDRGEQKHLLFDGLPDATVFEKFFCPNT